jgi:hypothetical protein
MSAPCSQRRGQADWDLVSQWRIRGALSGLQPKSIISRRSLNVKHVSEYRKARPERRARLILRSNCSQKHDAAKLSQLDPATLATLDHTGFLEIGQTRCVGQTNVGDILADPGCASH